LERTIEALDMGQRVTLLPGVEPGSADLLGAYQAADTFVLPSQHEPFGIVVLEAWAARVPVVCAAVGGLRDLVEDGRTAVIADRPTATALAAAIERMLADGTLRNTLRETAHRQCRQKYSWDRIACEYDDLYQDVRARLHRRVSA